MTFHKILTLWDIQINENSPIGRETNICTDIWEWYPKRWSWSIEQENAEKYANTKTKEIGWNWEGEIFISRFNYLLHSWKLYHDIVKWLNKTGFFGASGKFYDIYFVKLACIQHITIYSSFNFVYEVSEVSGKIFNLLFCCNWFIYFS